MTIEKIKELNIEAEDNPIDILRANIEREFRFKTVAMGYDKNSVREYIDKQKEYEASLRKALEEENEKLKADLAQTRADLAEINANLKSKEDAIRIKDVALTNLGSDLRELIRSKTTELDSLIAAWQYKYNKQAKSPE